MIQPGWGFSLPKQSRTISPRNSAPVRESLSAGGRRLLSLDVLLALLALTGGLRLVFLAAAKPVLDVEAAPVARAFALSRLVSFPGGDSGASPLGLVQLAGYTVVTGAFGRHSPLVAVREAVVVAGIIGAILLWVLMRRLGTPRWVATTAVVVLAVSPLAIGLQHVVLMENLAVMWALAALVVCCSPRREPPLAYDALGALLLLIAVLTSPLALVFLPAAAWLLARHREPSRVLFAAVVFTLGLGLAFGPSAAELRPDLAGIGHSGIGAWITLDPVLVVVLVAAAILGAFVSALRPLAVVSLLLALALLLPGMSRPGVLAMFLPVGAILVAGVVYAGARANIAQAEGKTPERLLVVSVTVACFVATSLVAGWVTGLTKLNSAADTGTTLASARDWLQDNASGSRLLADDAAWAELAAGGWPTASLVPPAACGRTCPSAVWAVTTPAHAGPHPAAFDALLSTAIPAAIFGDGDEQVRIFRLATTDTPAPIQEERSRSQAGVVLASSNRVQADPEAARLLRQGQVDPRLLATTAAFAALHPVRVVALPEVPGEDAARQPRRQAVLSGDAAQITDFFVGQKAVFRPASVTDVPGGVRVTYPPVPPNGLLTPFDTP
jgi:hypothetical protein